jgi:predicted MFS family arabinose efflux permease
VPPAILRVRSLMTSSLIRGTLVTGMYGMFFLGALYLEQTRGFDAVQIGLAFLPMPIGIGFMSLFVTGRLVGRFGPGRTLAGGMTVVLGGMALLATVGETTAYFPTFGVGIALLGLGMGAAFAPLLELSMADVPADDVGLASGIIQMSMQLAAALGLAVLSTLAAGDSPAAGLSLAMTASAIAVAAALLLAIAEIRRSREQADVVALEREEDLQAIAA